MSMSPNPPELLDETGPDILLILLLTAEAAKLEGEIVPPPFPPRKFDVTAARVNPPLTVVGTAALVIKPFAPASHPPAI